MVSPVVVAFGALALLDEVVVVVCGSKLDAVLKRFVIFSNDEVCTTYGLLTWLTKTIVVY